MMQAESSHNSNRPEKSIQQIEVETLLDKVQNGDTDAFAGIIQYYGPKIQTFIYRILQNWEDARDISQETFVSAFQNIRKYKLKSNFQSWLFTIASRKSLDLLRKRKSRPVTTELEHENVGGSVQIQNHVLPREVEAAIEMAIKQLPHEQKVAMTLSIFENISTREIAEILRISVKSTEMHLYRARKTLQKELGSFLHDE